MTKRVADDKALSAVPTKLRREPVEAEEKVLYLLFTRDLAEITGCCETTTATNFGHCILHALLRRMRLSKGEGGVAKPKRGVPDCGQ